ncbi:MAG: amino acid adenylation domain-containing protein [Eisenbergiella sp.]
MSENIKISNFEKLFVSYPLPFDSLYDETGEYENEIVTSDIEEWELITNFCVLIYRYSYKTVFPIMLCKEKNYSLIIDNARDTFKDVKVKLQKIIGDSENISNQEILVIITEKFDKEIIEQFPNVVIALEIGKTQNRVYYRNSLIRKETILRFKDNFYCLLNEVRKNPDLPIELYNIVSQKEKELLSSFNIKEKDYNLHKTYMQVFYENVENNYMRVALCEQEKSITYKELNNISNYYAEMISGLSGKYVGIYMKNDLATAIGILAILKAGKVIVTINPTYPIKRVQQIVDSLGLEIILTCEHTYHIIDETKLIKNVVLIDAYIELNRTYTNIYNKVSLKDLCYIIYTSGTTGIPKGVKITQENIMIEINFFKEYFGINQEQKLLHTLNYSFDFGLYDLLSGMLYGGCLFCLNKKMMKNFRDYISFINENNINFINTTPSFFNILASFKSKFPTLQNVHLGGEKVTYEMIEKYVQVLEPTCSIYNGYGPCECTVGSNIHRVTDKEKYEKVHELASVPIGKPTDNSLIFVLDDNLLGVPINCLGELMIAGESLGEGYIDQQKNAEKFIELPDRGGIKIYKTGDLVRWLSNGNIEFIGRIDNQVKIHGFRIELSEIDSILMKNASVVEAKTIFYEGKLISYVKLSNEMKVNEIKIYLQKFLPYYMIPTIIYIIDEFPYLESRKIDVKKLIMFQEGRDRL